MKAWLPKSLRYQMLILTLLIVTAPILLAGYEVKSRAEEALISEKQAIAFMDLAALTVSLAKPYRLGFSAGVVFVGAETVIDAESLLNQADTIMYQQKKLHHLNA